MYTPIFLLTALAASALAAPSAKFDPKNPLNLPKPLPLDPSKLSSFDHTSIEPSKLASTFKNLIPHKDLIGTPAHVVSKDQCTSFCDEHKRVCGMLEIGASTSEGLCEKEYIGCVVVRFC